MSTPRSHGKFNKLSSLKQAEDWLLNMSEDSKLMILKTWNDSKSEPGEFSREFYLHLFDRSADIATRFPGDMDRQQQLMTSTLSKAIELTESADELILLLRAVGVRHAHYGIRAEHFKLMGESFLATLKNRLQDTLSKEQLQIWEKFYQSMSAIMINGMDESG